MRVFVFDESDDRDRVYESARRFFDQMLECFFRRPHTLQFESSRSRFRVNPRKFVPEINSDVIVSSLIGSEHTMATHSEYIRRLEGFSEVGFGATGYKYPDGKLTSADCFYEQSQDGLLNFVVLALVQPIQNNYRRRHAAWCMLERFN
jgi:hypothetical protein